MAFMYLLLAWPRRCGGPSQWPPMWGPTKRDKTGTRTLSIKLFKGFWCNGRKEVYQIAIGIPK